MKLKTIRTLFAVLGLASVSACSVNMPGKTSEDLLADRDKMDIARCAGTTNPDLNNFTPGQYKAYTECIVELNKRRSAQ